MLPGGAMATLAVDGVLVLAMLLVDCCSGAAERQTRPCGEHPLCLEPGHLVHTPRDVTARVLRWTHEDGASLLQSAGDASSVVTRHGAQPVSLPPRTVPTRLASGGFGWVDVGWDQPEVDGLTVVLGDDALSPAHRVRLSGVTTRTVSLGNLPKDFSLEEACTSTNPLYVKKSAEDLEATRLSVATNGAGTRIAVLASTCARVMLFLYDRGGALLAHVIVSEQPKVSLLVPLPARVAFDREAGRFVVTSAWFMHEDDRGWAYGVATVDPESGAFVPEATFPPSLRTSVAGALFVGERLFVFGTKSKAIHGVDNDTDEESGYLAELERGATPTKARVETIYDGPRECVFSDVAQGAQGDLYVAGEENRRHVDSGSWDGGGQALVLRYGLDLTVKDKKTFGAERRESARTVLPFFGRFLFEGWWQDTPNNHLPESEIWSASFVVSLPEADWDPVPVVPHLLAAP